MSFSLNPLKMVSNLVKAHVSNIGAVLTQPFRMRKELLSGNPVEALKEPFKTISTQYRNLGTIMSAGAYTPDETPRAQ